MSMSWRRDHLPQIVSALAQRPGHERVRTLVADILRYAFQADYLGIDHEVRMPEVRGRADMLFGATVFEFKRDLRQELPDVLARLPDYLREREAGTGRRYLGIATDGALFIAYELRNGALEEIARHVTRAQDPDALLGWLEPALSDRDDITPDPLTIQRELGRSSLTFARANRLLTELWARHAAHPEVALKRQLWDRLLRVVYGTDVGDESLFLQHTYLTIVAKTIAVRVLELRADDARAIMSGQALTDAGIHGAVESDFFDWILQDGQGVDLVLRIARQAARFRLRQVSVDVLKALYESLIDPAQRHDLGEYYTPDWLAAKVVRRAVTQPLTDRVFDPACGSGTFLFHAVRRLAAAAADAGWTAPRTLAACADRVRGLDVHPVAVIIARVTWLLALGDLVRQRDRDLNVPVFLGDAMQWNIRDLGDGRYVEVAVQDGPTLRIPGGFAEDQAKYEPALRAPTEGLEDNATPDQIRVGMLRLPDVTARDAADMAATFGHLQALYRAGRNHIWPFVLRNLVRPLWLSRPDQRADVMLGNPPWVAYRHLSAEMQTNLREACQAMNLWVGGVLTTQQDMCALFWARSAERYLRPGGTIAFVLPYAVLNRPAYAGMRRGDYRSASVAIQEAWSFDETVQPLFPVPASVMIATRQGAGALPATVERYSGVLPVRDASEAQSDVALRHDTVPWPPIPRLEGSSPYRARFRQGATIVPWRFFFVEREQESRLGGNPNAPMLRGKIGGQDKKPWNQVEPPEGPVEIEFVRPVILGESISPFRLIGSSQCVVPVRGDALLNSSAARVAGSRRLAAWLLYVEEQWSLHAAKDKEQRPKLTLLQQIDYMRKLSGQLPVPNIRVVYAASGILPAAAIIQDTRAIIEHSAYWASARSIGEAQYLCAVLNSEESRVRLHHMQPKGQGGARHFDNLVWELSIPEYRRTEPLHRALQEAAVRAEGVANNVALDDTAHFTRRRRAIRDALLVDGVAGLIDRLVARLLDGAPTDSAGGY
jgi:hypothetical protein